MTYKLNDIRDLRIDWRGDHSGGNSASIHFESGNERFHIWLYTPHHIPVEELDDGDVPFNMKDTLYANDIEPGYGHNTRKLDLAKPTHRKLRDLIAARIQVRHGNLNAAVRKAAAAYMVDRNEKQAQMKAQLASNIREAINNIPKPSSMAHTLLKLTDDELIELRGAMYNAKYPDARQFDGAGVVEL